MHRESPSLAKRPASTRRPCIELPGAVGWASSEPWVAIVDDHHSPDAPKSDNFEQATMNLRSQKASLVATDSAILRPFMVVLPWVWLNEAALLIADRRAGTQSYTDSDARLIDARNQLLDRAYRGVLEIQGSSFSVEEERHEEPPDGPPHEINWRPLNPSLFSEEAYNGSAAKIAIDWNHNLFTYESFEADPPCGYDHLRVRNSDIDLLWPPIPTCSTEIPEKASVHHQHDELSEEPYTTEWIMLLHKAIKELGITDGNQPKAHLIQEWFRSQTVHGLAVSQNLAKAMTTIVRRPESMVGGLKPSRHHNKRE